MNSPLMTNVLLVVVAALLLVLVIQNGLRETASGYGSASSGTPAVSNPHGTNPTVSSGASMMAHSMFFQALRAFPDGCDGKKILEECDSPAARVVKAEIESKVAEGLGPRQVFDFVVNTYGIDALTEEAQRIRSARVKP